MIELGLLPREFLLIGVVSYLVAAALTFALGFLFGGRSPTASLLPALGVMVVGVLLTSFAAAGVMLLAGRVLGGLGAGVAVGVTVAVLRRVQGSRAVAATVVAVLSGLAAVAAPFVNSAISEMLSFRLPHLATEPFLSAAIFAAAVSGIAQTAGAGRAARSTPYGMPYPPPYPAPPNPVDRYPAPQYPVAHPMHQAPQYPATQNPASPHPATPYPPRSPGR